MCPDFRWERAFLRSPESERSSNDVADKFDLRRDIQLSPRVKSAVYDEKTNRWDMEVESGQRVRAQDVIAAVGVLSARYVPRFAGIARFKGETYHTSRWPQEKIDLPGKRVAVIGTGAPAVQLLPIVAKEVNPLAVFQGTPTYCASLRHSVVAEEEQRQFRANYPEMHNLCRNDRRMDYGVDPLYAREELHTYCYSATGRRAVGTAHGRMCTAHDSVRYHLLVHGAEYPWKEAGSPSPRRERPNI
jgi:cation diffusion facilitator CzcD-associated flavoprotein CzcO